jgi:hypothetical protein
MEKSGGAIATAEIKLCYAFVAIAIILAAGVLGAYCRKIFDGAGEEDKPFPHIVVPGIVAAALVPLFLSIGQSDLFQKLLDGTKTVHNAFVLFGFCLLAAVTARSFVESLAKEALQTARDAQTKAAAAKDTAEGTRDVLAEHAENQDLPLEKGAQDQSEALRDAGVSGQQEVVLKSLLEGSYVRRSVTGIARETGLTKDSVRNALQDLIIKDLVVERESKRTGALLYQAKLKGAKEATGS